MELYILISIFILFFLYNLTDAEFIKLLRYRLKYHTSCMLSCHIPIAYMALRWDV